MTPNTLRVHKCNSLSAKRKLAKTRQKRRDAVNQRWQMRILSLPQDTSADGGETDELEETNEEPEGMSEEEEANHDTDEGMRENQENDNETKLSARTRRRAILQLVALLPKNIFDSTKLFLQIFKRIAPLELMDEVQDAIHVLKPSGNLSFNQLKYNIRLVSDVFSKRACFRNDLLKHWLDLLLQHSVIEAIFDSSKIILPAELVPKSLSLARQSRDICKEILSTSSHSKTNARHVAVELAVKVAKAGNLSSDRFGDITLLSDTIACTRKYAKRILVSIENGTENDLFTNNRRCTSIHASEWPSKLTKFVLLPENSRAVPGQDSVSIRYGVRHPKYILLKSRVDIAKKFKEENPDCSFSISTLMREFPQYAVTPTSRDLERNTCPTHANARRLIKVLNNKLHHKKIAQKLPSSCRAFALSLLCHSPVATIDPLTWNADCVNGKCSNCPGLKIDIPNKMILKEMVTFSQWASKKQMVTIKGEQKEKYVFALYTESSTLEDAIERLRKLAMPLALHIYTAAMQWDAHNTARLSLDKFSIITIEDYQRNLEAIFSENPTSMGYSGNKVTTALYPICIEYIGDDGLLKKGAISFISDDKLHDHQQARDFERRMFEIVREKLGRPILNWKRFSDGCDGQFRSRFTVADLMKACERFDLQQASFDFFEANEGKNISDTVGSIVKCGYVRAMHKHEQGVHNASDVVSVIKTELQEEMKKFEFFIVEEFRSTDHVSDRDECVVEGIMKIHSLVTHDDKVICRQWTCTTCTVDTVCEDCKQSSTYVDITDVALGEDDDTLLRDRIKHNEDDGQTDLESDDESSSDEDDEDGIAPGDIVWGLSGRMWYPA